MADTELLLHMDNLVDPVTYVDSSDDTKIITGKPDGNTPIQQDTVFKFTAATLFDGFAQYLELDNDGAFGLLGDYTIECWVYPLTDTQEQILWMHAEGSSKFFEFGLGSVGLRPYISIKSGGVTTISTTTNVLINEWTHIAVSKNGSTTRIYINGVIGVEDVSDFTPALYNDNPVIGKSAIQSNGYVDGYLEEYRLSQIARYGAENFTPAISPFSPEPEFPQHRDYCSVEEVLDVAQKYRTDLDDNNNYGAGAFSTLTAEMVEEIIHEAELWVDSVLRPRFDVREIEALDPFFPPAITTMCKLRAAIILLNRSSIVDPDNSQKKIAMILQNELNAEVSKIVNGTLFDINENLIVPITNPQLQVKPIYTDMGGHYDNGNRNY